MNSGDVYLGAPCAVPLDPRHRLVVPKYNPARTFTPEGAVGIGGAYMCIYPMDSPGGYQLIGSTLPIWDTWQRQGKPWLLNLFDLISFYPVSEPELVELRAQFVRGDLKVVMSEGFFDIDEYHRRLVEVARQTSAWKDQQKKAQQIQIGEEALSLARLGTPPVEVCTPSLTVLILLAPSH